MDKNVVAVSETDDTTHVVATVGDVKNTSSIDIEIEDEAVDEILAEDPIEQEYVEATTPHTESIMSPSIEPTYMAVAAFSTRAPHEYEEHEDVELERPSGYEIDESGSRKKKNSLFKTFGTKNLMGGMSQSRFKRWTRTELVDLLITNDIELRDESNIAHVSLRDLCEALYEGLPMPEKVPPLSPEHIHLMDKYARIIQNSYIERLYRRRVQLELDEYEAEIQRYEDEKMILGDIDACMDIDLAIASADEGDIEAGGEISSPSQDNETKKSVKIEGKSMRRKKLVKSLSTRVVQALDTDWVPPSWQKAQRTADYLHPRKGGKGGEKFHIKSTTTGRHCMLNGFGEQCDLWGEGMVSEFAIYGPGTTVNLLHVLNEKLFYFYFYYILLFVMAVIRNYELFQVFKMVILGICNFITHFITRTYY